MTTERMTIALPKEMADMVKKAVESGDYSSGSEVFRDALRIWRYNRQMEQEAMDEIRAALVESEADMQAGRVYPAEEVFSELLTEIESPESAKRN